MSRKINALCQTRDFDENTYVGYLMGASRQKGIIRKDVYGEPKKYKFENIYVYGPEKYDEYLTCLYKDWRQLPPEDKRHPPHALVEVDLNTPYQEYGDLKK